MNFMEGTSKMRIKLISGLLDNALFEFLGKGPSTSKGEEKLQHVTDFGCVRQPPDVPVAHLLCWLLDHLVRIQNTFRKPKDLEKFIYQIEHTDFDYGHEFSHIQYMFTKIINTEVLTEIELFYSGDDATDHNGYPTKILGIRSQSQVCFFDHIPQDSLS
jgi:hypothetical protein